MEILQREFIYVWYYFDIQFRQVFRYWVLGMAIGSAVSVFGKDKVHAAFSALGNRKPGVPGVFLASLLGDCFPALYVWYNPHCGVFYTERHEG